MEYRSNRMKRTVYRLDDRGHMSKRQGWIVYRGFTLDSRKVGRGVAGVWEISIYRDANHSLVDRVTSVDSSQKKAFEKAKRVVDAMMGD